ncbi:MAG: hypothetical protein ACI4I2_03640 [Oscillospiraceae bacterium]
MNMKKTVSGIAAAVMAVSALSIAATAADWSKASYADDDPNTVSIVSTDANGVTFTQAVGGGSCKARIMLVDILANPEDASKIKSGSWDVTYTGLSSLTGTEIGWLGGGTWCASTNSAGFGLSPKETNEDGTTVWDDTQTVSDSFKYLLPTQVPTDAAEAEYVFMDWSGQDLVANNITVTVSNLKFFDEDGNEIAQKEYGGASDAAADTTDDAPAADTTATTSTATGNTTAAAIASVMAVAGAAAIAAKKRK